MTDRNADTDADGEPTQTTDSGLDIPIPTRGQVFRDLGKVVRRKADEGSDASGPQDEG